MTFYCFTVIQILVLFQHISEYPTWTWFDMEKYLFIDYIKKKSFQLIKIQVIHTSSSIRHTSRIQNRDRHIGQLHFEFSHVSRSFWSCRLANHRARHEEHHIGRQKQFVHLSSPWSKHCLLIFTSGFFTIHAKQLSRFAWLTRYFGFLSISLLNTSMNRSIIVVWNFTDDKIYKIMR